jgi:hypothetical protein
VTPNPTTAIDRHDLLVRTGQALYGYHWQSAVARYLKIDVRTVQRWAAGEFLPPLGVLHQLVDHCGERIGAIEKMRKELNQRLSS